LEQATHWCLIARNPVRLVAGPHLVRREIEPLDPEQARRLLPAVRGDRLEALSSPSHLLSVFVAVRRLGLKWDDVDVDTTTLSVQRSLQRGDRGWNSWT